MLGWNRCTSTSFPEPSPQLAARHADAGGFRRSGVVRAKRTMVRYVEDASGPRSASQADQAHAALDRAPAPVPVELGRARPTPRRRDAVRNRVRLIEATRDLLVDRRLDELTVDEIAEEACVGKGTVYRAFGDKAGIARALLDDETRLLQAAVLTGPPPLGPGAPARERLDAFVDAYLDFLDRNVEVLVVCEHGTERRFDNPVLGFWLAYVRAQLRMMGEVDDPDATAHLLLTALRADLYRHLCRSGFDRARIRAMARRVIDPR